MKQTPILFQPEMVVAINKNLKSQTRRTKGLGKINQFPNDWKLCGISSDGLEFLFKNIYTEVIERIKSPYGVAGDLLWVKETYRLCAWNYDDGEVKFEYKDGAKVWNNDFTNVEWLDRHIQKLEEKGYITAENAEFEGHYDKLKTLPWNPSIFMPKDACRTYLEILNVTPERLNSINDFDAEQEGVDRICGFEDSIVFFNYKEDTIESHPFQNPKDSFQSLWQKINGIPSWYKNEWVWRIEFKITVKP